MPALHPYHLAFPGGLHLGARGVNLEEAGVQLPADTLFAALVVSWQLQGQDPGGFTAPFAQRDPPFLLTSAFPYVGGVRFYPMPVDRRRLFSPQGWPRIQERGKALKGIRYLSEDLLRRSLQGEFLDHLLFPQRAEDDPQDQAPGVALQGGVLWLTREEAESLPDSLRREKKRLRPLRSLRHLAVWKESRVPRVTVDRVSSASNIFHAGRVRFAPGCGLWFGVHWRRMDARVDGAEIAYPDALERCLALLQDNGLGGERTSGYGQFRLDDGQAAVQLPDPSPGEPAWLLSRYLPRADELPRALAGPGAAYELVTVRGWVQSLARADQRRRALTLLTEGSLVSWPEAGVVGHLADVRPVYCNPDGEKVPGLPHPVYRYGLALGLGLPAAQEAREEVHHA